MVAIVLLVGSGGFVGSVLRYLAGLLVQHLSGGSAFPYGTLAVNVLGCLLIGFLNGLTEGRQVFSPETRGLIFIGLLGGFTTFSSFGYETIALARDGQVVGAFSNVALQLALGLGAVWVGYRLSLAT